MTYIYRTRSGREIRIDDLTEVVATQSDGHGHIREATAREIQKMDSRGIKNGDDVVDKSGFN